MISKLETQVDDYDFFNGKFADDILLGILFGYSKFDISGRILHKYFVRITTTEEEKLLQNAHDEDEKKSIDSWSPEAEISKTLIKIKQKQYDNMSKTQKTLYYREFNNAYKKRIHFIKMLKRCVEFIEITNIISKYIHRIEKNIYDDNDD